MIINSNQSMQTENKEGKPKYKEQTTIKRTLNPTKWGEKNPIKGL